MNNSLNNGFYCGENIYNKIKADIFVVPEEGNFDFVYKGLSFYYDKLATSDSITGIGEPYASMVDKLREAFG